VHSSPLATFPFFLSYLLPLVVILSVFERGWWSFAPIGIVFVVLPLLDSLFGVAAQWREAPELAFNRYFRAVTWFWVPLQAFLLAWVLREVRSGQLSTGEIVAATLSMGIAAGAIGATFAHELIHRRYAAERALGHVLLALIGYTHFALHHIQGHHRWVATPRDPATARLNESFYQFLPRSVVGGFISAWHFEDERLRRRNKLLVSFSNRILRGLGLQAVACAGLFVWGGRVPMFAYLGQAAVAITIIEAINYLEHYGLMRRELGNGEFERVSPQHSWDSAYRLTNWLLINLPRHADHHCSANKRYQALELLPMAPRLPAGYATMFLMALLPPLWFSVMNPRVKSLARAGRA
jgi:alkane 1-monooxygenase